MDELEQKIIKKKMQIFFTDFPQIKRAKNTLIYNTQDSPDYVLFLAEGYVRMHSYTDQGQELSIAILRPSSFFSLLHAFQPNSDNSEKYLFTTLSDCLCHEIPTEDLKIFLQSDPQLMFLLNERLLGGLQGLIRRIEYLTTQTASEKTASILLYFASIIGQPHPDGIKIPIPFTHESLSTWTGTTRVSVSQAISKYKQEGLIQQVNDGIIIYQLEKLQDKLIVKDSQDTPSQTSKK